MNKEVAAVPQQLRTDIAPIVPRTMEEMVRLSKYLAVSEIVPKDFVNKEANIFVAIQWGMEIGLLPLQALQSIAVIHGRPTLWGDAGLALVKASGLCEYFIEEIGAEAATCRTKRRGEEGEHVRTFAKADAQKAGLWEKNVHAQYPKRMLQMRARWWLLRDVYPDVLRGVHGAEERIDEEIDVTPTPPAGVEQPQSASTPAKPQVLDAEEVKSTPTPAPVGDAAPSSSDPATPTPTPTTPAPAAANDAKPAVGSAMGEGQLRILRAKLKNAALTETDLIAKFGQLEDLKFAQFDEITNWINERVKAIAR